MERYIAAEERRRLASLSDDTAAAEAARLQAETLGGEYERLSLDLADLGLLLLRHGTYQRFDALRNLFAEGLLREDLDGLRAQVRSLARDLDELARAVARLEGRLRHEPAGASAGGRGGQGRAERQAAPRGRGPGPTDAATRRRR